MADEKADAKPKAEAASKKSKLPILIIAALMGVEGVGVMLNRSISTSPDLKPSSAG